MTTVRRLVAAGAGVLGLLIVDAPAARAQGLAGRLAIEAIASASGDARAVDDPNVILDLVGTIRLAEGLDVVVRPWAMRRPGGDWIVEMYQLQVRYVVDQNPVPRRCGHHHVSGGALHT